MEYSITPSEDGKYIILKVKGEMTRAAAMKVNREVHTLGKKLGVNRYLEDVTEARNVESTLDGYKFAYEDMKQAPEVDRFARVALLVSPNDHSHDFIETVSRNTGLNVKIFRAREEAVQHLTKD